MFLIYAAIVERNTKFISPVSGSLVRAAVRNVPLIPVSISALCILFACLYRILPHLSFFLHFFLTYLLPYFSFENKPAPF